MNRFYTAHGSMMQPVYDMQIDPLTGLDVLVQIGERNAQEEIDSYAPSCDLNVIIQRVRNGELDLLRARTGMYGDFTGVPTTMAELLQTRIDGKNMYNALPDSVRRQFSSLDDFLSTAGSVDWLKKLGFDVDSAPMEPEQKEGNVSE